MIREICEYIKEAYDQHTSQQEIDDVVKERIKVFNSIKFSAPFINLIFIPLGGL